MHVFGDPQLQTGMPARSVEHQHNLLCGSGSHCLREGSEFDGKQLQVHTGRQVKDGATGGGMDKAHHIAPGEAVLDGRYRPLANRRPHPSAAPV